MTIKNFTRMLFLAAALALAAPVAVFAQQGLALPSGKARPAATSAGYVAMLYTKMTRQAPEFEKWAMASKSYTDAADLDKRVAATQKIAELKAVYDLLTPNEPIIITLPAKLSDYSQMSGGFFIENLREDQLFSYDFFGRYYGLAAMNLMDFQWIKTTRAEAEAITRVKAEGGDTPITMVLYVDPKFADKSAPFNYEGQPHWLISGEVRKLALFGGTMDTLLWGSPDKEAEEAVSQELMNLKQ